MASGFLESFIGESFGLDIQSDNLVIADAYTYKLARQSDGSFKTSIEAASETKSPKVVISLSEWKGEVGNRYGANPNPDISLWKNIVAGTLSGSIDASLIQVRNYSKLLSVVLRPVYERQTIQGQISRKLGLVGVTIGVLNLADNIWKTSNDPNLSYYEKVSLNLLHETSTGSTLLAGMAGAWAGTNLANPYATVAGAALLGGMVASFTDTLVAALKEYYYSH